VTLLCLALANRILTQENILKKLVSNNNNREQIFIYLIFFHLASNKFIKNKKEINQIDPVSMRSKLNEFISELNHTDFVLEDKLKKQLNVR
jgi:hypothetical protein